MWTRSISMYDSSSETPESRSVAAVSDDDNFRFSSWRQFIILFSCFQCFCCKVSPVNAWWWSGSLWFPTYNALPPENVDNMSAEQSVCLSFLDFHLILVLAVTWLKPLEWQSPVQYLWRIYVSPLFSCCPRVQDARLFFSARRSSEAQSHFFEPGPGFESMVVKCSKTVLIKQD